MAGSGLVRVANLEEEGRCGPGRIRNARRFEYREKCSRPDLSERLFKTGPTSAPILAPSECRCSRYPRGLNTRKHWVKWGFNSLHLAQAMDTHDRPPFSSRVRKMEVSSPYGSRPPKVGNCSMQARQKAQGNRALQDLSWHVYRRAVNRRQVPVRSKTRKEQKPLPSRFTFIDLFAGIGGARLGLESAGGECVFSSEWNGFAAKTYQENFGDLPKGDIRQIPSSEIPDHDLLSAGFPCQPFSLAGVSKKRALNMPTGFEDPKQGTLFFEIARILRDKQPKAFLLENVKNLLHYDHGATFATILATLTELGYSTSYRVLDARLVVPQHRERVFIVGFRRNLKLPEFVIPEPKNRQPALRSILQRKPEPRYTLTDHLWSYLKDYAEKHRKAGNGFGYGLAPLDGVSRTLSARYFKDGAEVLIPQPGHNPRRLTPRECARLMGFPDSFRIPVSDTQAYKQFGNAVVPGMVAEIGLRMNEWLSADTRPIERPLLH